MSSDEIMGVKHASPTKPDMVNHPPHYTSGKFEVIEVIEDIIQHFKNPVEAFLAGQAIKYIARAPLKGNYQEDISKAMWYLHRLDYRGRS